RTGMQLEEQRQSISPMLWNRQARRFQNSTGILKVSRLDSAKVCLVRFVASGVFVLQICGFRLHRPALTIFTPKTTRFCYTFMKTFKK
ncbi:MAG: hypothetical protein ACI4QF_07385, partial [Kiritimatiellia bacterium]